MSTDEPDVADLFAALDAAYEKARAAHVAGTCGESEWTCSYCESTQRGGVER